MLSERDESYGNTPLHVACSLYSVELTEFLIKAGCDVTIKNLAERTPEEIIDNEIKLITAHIASEEKDMSLERLRLVLNLFNA